MFALSQLRLPVILAPMAGGFATPALVAAVSTAGGLGSLGFAYSPPERIAAELRTARALSPGPLNANFFVFRPVEPPEEGLRARALAALAGLPGNAGVDVPDPREPFFLDLHAQLEAVWQEKPAVLTFHLGLPSGDVVARAHGLGIAVGASATCVEAAQEAQSIGVDFVVAQGIEAGGHRGVFDPAAPDEELPTMELLGQLARALRVPLVAAGGIMSGGDIRRALAAGAAAVQMGTAFLTCVESGASAAHRHFLLEERGRGTRLTDAYSGRPARGIVTDFMDRMQGQPRLPFPMQNLATGPMRQAAARRSDGEYQSLWAGARYAFCRATSAAQLLMELEQEMALP